MEAAQGSAPFGGQDSRLSVKPCVRCRRVLDRSTSNSGTEKDSLESACTSKGFSLFLSKLAETDQGITDVYSVSTSGVF